MTIAGAATYWYGDLSEDALARVWKDNPAGTEVRMQNHFASLGVINRSLNHILGHHGPVVFSQCIQDGDFENAGSAPLMYLRWFDGMDNATQYRVHVIALARESGSGDAYANLGGVSAGHNEITTGSSVHYPQDAYYFSFDVTRGAVTDAIKSVSLNTYNGMTVHSITVQQLLPAQLDSSLSHIVVPNYPTVGGDPVVHDTLEATRAALHEARSTYTGMAFCWSALAEGGTWLTPASTNENAIIHNSTSWANAFDSSFTSRDGDSPGWNCSAYKMGVGTSNDVWIKPYIFAYAYDVDLTDPITGNGGYFKFEGPAGTTTTSSTITIPYGTSPAWIAGDAFCVNSSIQDSTVDATANKVDPLMQSLIDAGTGNDAILRIYAVVGVYMNL